MLQNFFLILGMLVLLANSAQAEGSKDITPRTNLGSVGSGNANNDHVGRLQHNDGANSNSFLMPSTYTGSGGFDARERMLVRMRPNDTLFYGVRRADAGGAGLVLTLRYDNTGANVAGLILQQTTLANGNYAGTLAQANGVIQNDARNNVGPKYAGYNGSIFTLPSGGYDGLWWHNNTGNTIDVWIEFTRQGNPNSGGQRTTYDLWDFTVRNNGEKPGRLYSKSWSFQALGSSNKLSRDFQFYVAVPDPTNTSTFYIKEIDLAGTEPYGVIFKCNSQGTNVGATFEERRKSISTNNADPEFDIFVNPPDFNLYPSAVLPTYSISYVSFCQPDGVNGGAIFTYFSTKPGYGQIVLDLDGNPGYNPGTEDVFLESFFPNPGFNQIFWDGKNGLGVSVPSNTPIINTLLTGLFSPVHFPLWDAEKAKSGFKIRNIRPGVQDYDKLFWDESNFTSNWDGVPQVNLTGQKATATSGVHVWGLSGSPGNNRLVNTWGYGRVIEITQNLLYTYICDQDGDGISNVDDPDDDNDGIKDLAESGNEDPLQDHDGDSVPNYLDPDYVHPTLGVFVDDNEDGVNDIFDADDDGIINSFDLDSDGDGLSDVFEAGGPDPNNDGMVGNGPLGQIGTIVDLDNDGLEDSVDDYDGGSGVGEITSGTPLSPPDTDQDGVPDYLDPDSDNDGLLDNIESQGNTPTPASGVDSNNNGVDDAYDPYLSGSFISPINSDGTADPNRPFTDTFPDHLDIDSDNDGIADIIEGQSTSGYIAPSGTDANNNGVDDAFDPKEGGTAVVLEDTDNDGTPDFRDLNSDGDTESDFLEAHDDNNDGTADHAAVNTDADGDGMLDASGSASRYDQFALGASGNNADNNGNTATSPFPNSTGGTEPNWRDGQEIIWNGSSWSGGSGPGNGPDDGTNDGNKTATIQSGAQAVLTTNAAVKNLIINTGAELVIEDACFEVTGDATVQGTGKFVLKGTSETQYGQYKGPAMAQAEVQMVFNEAGWHNMASPVSDKTVADFAAANNSSAPGASPTINLLAGQENLFWYNTNLYGGKDLGHGQGDDYSHAWGKWIPALAGDPFNHSRSYNLYLDDSYNGPNQTLSISGTLNDGDLSYVTSDKYYGWNNVPNPYPTVVDWEEIIEDFDHNGTTTNDFTLSFHIWDPANQTYAAYQGVLGAGVGTGAAAPGNYQGATPAEVDVVSDNTRYIAPFQSFWIERVDALPEDVASSVAPTDKTFFMKNSHRVLCEKTRHYKTQDQVDKIRLLIQSDQNTYKDQTVLLFDPSFSDAYNKFEDTKKFFSPNPEATQLFSMVENKALIIGSFAYPDFEHAVQPLGVFGINGSTLTVSNLVEPFGWDVYVEDVKTGKLVHLSSNGDHYTFIHDKRFGAHRLNLIYASGRIDVEQFEPKLTVFNVQEGIRVNLNRIREVERVVVSTLTGQVVYQSKVGSETTFSVPMQERTHQVYVVAVYAANGVFVEKIVR